MDAFMPHLAISLVVGVVVAVVSACVTVCLAIRRFRAEKWWERKADAYAGIFNALHDIKRYAEDQEYAPWHPGEPRNEHHLDELKKNVRAGIRDIQKAVDTSAFILCPQAQQALTTLMDILLKTEGEMSIEEVGKGADYDACRQVLLGKKVVAVATCIEHLSKCARRDLSLPKGKNV